MKTVLYVGVTSYLVQRMHQRKSKVIHGFTKQYKCSYLVYFDETESMEVATHGEKQLKGWTRAKSEKLIYTLNQNGEDLSTKL